MANNDPLQERIDELLKYPGLDQALIHASDLILRLRMGQITKVTAILNTYCTLNTEGQGPDLDEPLYKVIELGELLKCKNQYGTCEYAKDCWITRKGFCKKQKISKEE